MKVSELADALNNLSTQVDKAQTEILAELKTLEDSLADIDVPPEADAALTSLKTKVQALDDLNPDAPASPAP